MPPTIRFRVVKSFKDPLSRLVAESVWIDSESNLNSKNEWRGEKITRIVVSGSVRDKMKKKKEITTEEEVATKIEEMKKRVNRANVNLKKLRVVDDHKSLEPDNEPSLVKFSKRERVEEVLEVVKKKKIRLDDSTQVVIETEEEKLSDVAQTLVVQTEIARQVEQGAAAVAPVVVVRSIAASRIAPEPDTLSAYPAVESLLELKHDSEKPEESPAEKTSGKPEQGAPASVVSAVKTSGKLKQDHQWPMVSTVVKTSGKSKQDTLVSARLYSAQNPSNVKVASLNSTHSTSKRVSKPDLEMSKSTRLQKGWSSTSKTKIRRGWSAKDGAERAKASSKQPTRVPSSYQPGRKLKQLGIESFFARSDYCGIVQERAREVPAESKHASGVLPVYCCRLRERRNNLITCCRSRKRMDKMNCEETNSSESHSDGAAGARREGTLSTTGAGREDTSDTETSGGPKIKPATSKKGKKLLKNEKEMTEGRGMEIACCLTDELWYQPVKETGMNVTMEHPLQKIGGMVASKRRLQ